MTRRFVSWWPILLALAGIAMLAWTGLRLVTLPDRPSGEEDYDPDEDDDYDEPPADLLVGEHFQVVRAKEVDVYQTFKGRVKGEGQHPIRAPKGMLVPVLVIHKEPGEFVEKGDPLITLAGEQVEKALEEARAAGDQEKIERFEMYLEHVVLRAPVDGQVLHIWCDPGHIPVDEGIPMMTLADRSSFTFVVMLPEDVLRSSAPMGAELEIELEDGLGTVQGTVTSLGETAEGRLPALGGQVNVILGLAAHEGLEDGLAGEVRVPASRQVAGLVPKKAVEWRDGVAVVRVAEAGTILERTLRIDGEEGDDYRVLYGVNVGESVVVPGPAQ